MSTHSPLAVDAHDAVAGAFRVLSGATGELSRQGRAMLSASRSSGADAAAPASPVQACPTCGGDGSRFPGERVYCPDCRWLRPLARDYHLPVDAFLWRLDADAMHSLQGIGPLVSVAHALSEHVGRPWFEAAVNGLRLSEQQLPDVFALAIKAARIVGLSHLPEIYVSGDHTWESVTMGSRTSSFIAIGSVLMNFKGDDLAYLLGREMGHARAGHALWTTVVNLLAGNQTANRSLFGGGVLSFLSLNKLLESGINAPLMTWQRHSAITADRAGLLVVGDLDVARRVTLQWTLHSFPLAARINMDAWLAQEDAFEHGALAQSEFAMSSTPYTAHRLKLLREFAAEDEYHGWRRTIEEALPAPAPAIAAPVRPPQQQRPPVEVERFVCIACKAPMIVPKSTLQGGGAVNVRCPNPACGKVLKITPRRPPSTEEEEEEEDLSDP